MRKVHTAPMEVYAPKPNGRFELEPYEAGWATEALAMVYVREARGERPSVAVTIQLSVDGARWIDLPGHPEPITKVGGYAFPVTNFGNWLRLVGDVTGGTDDAQPVVVLDIYWVLK